jgi:hypothetical protein
VRHIDELRAMKRQRLFDFSIWVDRSRRLDPEPDTSISIRKEDCDFLLDNNNAIEDLEIAATR